MGARTGSLNRIRIGSYTYLFFLLGNSYYLDPLREEIDRHWESFAQDLQGKGLVVRPWDKSGEDVFEEFVRKPWPQQVHERANRELYPFMLVINRDFRDFNPEQHRWVIFWFSELKDHADLVRTLFHGIASQARSGEDLFRHLAKQHPGRRYPNPLKYLEIKPEIFGIKLDVAAMLSDAGEALVGRSPA